MVFPAMRGLEWRDINVTASRTVTTDFNYIATIQCTSVIEPPNGVKTSYIGNNGHIEL